MYNRNDCVCDVTKAHWNELIQTELFTWSHCPQQYWSHFCLIEKLKENSFHYPLTSSKWNHCPKISIRIRGNFHPHWLNQILYSNKIYRWFVWILTFLGTLYGPLKMYILSSGKHKIFHPVLLDVKEISNKINIQANNTSFTVKKFSKVYKYYFLHFLLVFYFIFLFILFYFNFKSLLPHAPKHEPPPFWFFKKTFKYFMTLK